LETEYKIFLENGILKVKIPHKTAETLNQTNIDSFEAELFGISFKRINGKITGFDANAGRVKNLKFDKINPY
jgi:Fe-S cluster assembly iron-binding protein IscA